MSIVKLVTNKHTGRKVLMNRIRDCRNNDFDSEENEMCPFCPHENEEEANFRIEKNNQWQVKAIDNKYPALMTDIDEFQQNRCDYGKHEVLIETREHLRSFYDFNDDEFIDIIKMYQNRFIELSKDKNIKYTIIYKNHLKKAGASKIHSHSQILSMSFIPPEIKREMNIVKEGELWGDKRIIRNSENFETFIPEDSYLSGEIIIENKHNQRFENINKQEVHELSKEFAYIFRKIKNIYGKIPFNTYLHSLPKVVDLDNFRWHIHIIPRKGKFGGFELGTGLYINSIDLDKMWEEFCEDKKNKKIL